VYPRERPAKEWLNLLGTIGTSGEDGEVQVLGEAMGFDIALLQAGATFEDPLIAQDRIRA